MALLLSQDQLLVVRIFRGNKNYIYSQLGQRGAAKPVTASIFRSKDLQSQLSMEEGSYCGTWWDVFTHLVDDSWTWCTSESDF